MLHGARAQVAPQCGIGALARALNRLLVEHIRGALPGLRARLDATVERRAAELKTYGELPPGHTPASRCGTVRVSH
jgi:dynamin 1-like protein